jgi:HEAT repeat protein
MNVKLHLPRPCSLVSRALLPLVLALPACAVAQEKPAAQPDASAAAAKPQSPAELLARCWQLLTDSAQDAKHVETRTQALNAISYLGSNSRADELIAAAMKDPDLDVRSAAILAAGRTRARTLDAPVQKLLNDPEPQVVFAAATTLWKQFDDKSGEDILAAIAAGDRKANPSLMHGAEHDMSRTMHSPSALAKIGLVTGAGMVLGPFGFSISAIEYARKNGSDGPRVQSIDLLGQERNEGVHDQMKSSLVDSDASVRAAAVRVLGSFHRAADASDIAELLDDSRLPVRLAAAAAYINCRSGVARARTKGSV